MTVGFPEEMPKGEGGREAPDAFVRPAARGYLALIKWWFILGLTLLVAGCDFGAPGPHSPVATVNGEAITREQFEEALALRRDALDQGLQSEPAVREALESRVLEEMITRRLLLQEAARQGVSPTPDAVGKRLAELFQGYGPDEFNALISERGVSPDAFRARVAEDLTMELLIEKALKVPEAPPADKVEAYYREHLEELHRPVRARALHLMVATAEEAEKLRAVVMKGADFSEMARRHSLGPEAAQDGDLGWVSPGQMPEAFDEAIFSLKPKEVSQVVKSPYGYHLFKLLEVKRAGRLSLEEARPAIVARLEAETREENYKQWLEELRTRARVVVNKPLREAKR